jgi:outer membrane protein assembly factor BamB
MNVLRKVLLWSQVLLVALISISLQLQGASLFGGEDWPMWRYDASRSAASPNKIPESLSPLWTRTFSPRQPVWDDPLNQDLMSYDSLFEPIVLGNRLIVGFNDQDKLIAMDTTSGENLWTFFAEAPIRLAPVGWRDRVFVCSDDGYLYCLNAADGKVVWKHHGAPNSQHAIGNRRLTSAWPARGGPVIKDDTVYYAASIWPFMGTFLYALDAESGRIKWVNDSTGSQYMKQPHSAPAFAGVAPQGALVATDRLLIVPGGRSVPAVFDRASGEMKYFELNAGGKGNGGAFVTADATHFYVHTRVKGTRAFHLGTGLKTAFAPNEPVVVGDYLFSAEMAEGRAVIRAYPASLEDDKAREPLWSIDADGTKDLILAGDHLIAAGSKTLSVIRRPDFDAGSMTGGQVVSTIPTESSIGRLLVADRKLFGIYENGSITAFGESSVAIAATGIAAVNQEHGNDDRQESNDVAARKLLSYGDASGYAFWFGPCEASMAIAMGASKLFEQLAIVDSDSLRVNPLRKSLDEIGVYGRLTCHVSTPMMFRPPQYVANMVFVAREISQSATANDMHSMYGAVRPYGGVMLLLSLDAEKLAESIRAMNLEQAKVEIVPEGVLVRREGALPGAADWTHQYGDIANTIKSNDKRVKLPLGVLWFGGTSNLDVLPRHGHGPPEQIVNGRVFIEGISSLSARDVYTGRLLWKREFGDLGTFDVYFDNTYEDTPLDPKYNQVHIPGANGRGTNYVVTPECIYLVVGNQCKMLDPATGDDKGLIELPGNADGSKAEWGFIGVYDRFLLGGVGFANYRESRGIDFPSDNLLSNSKKGFGSKSLDKAASKAIVAFDRHSGKELWRVDAKHSFWHNGIVAGGDRIYCLDRDPNSVAEAMKRRGIKTPGTYRIVSFDAATGKELWEVKEKIFGTWLGYSEKHDLLLQAGSQASDRLADEVGTGMRVYHGKDGKLAWERDTLKYSGPCILHRDSIITNVNSYTESAGAFDLLTGEQKMTQNPITGQMQPWKITRSYGCNSIVASENMLTFRSGAAAYYDLSTDSGTGNLGGFRSGCTANLIAAGGVLNAPDYTRTCSCSYQNQTSIALIHMPDVELWSVHSSTNAIPKDSLVENLAVNFGAAGDRRDANGELWIEYPSLAGDPAPIVIQTNEQAKAVRRHISAFAGNDKSWLLSSGFKNLSELKVGLYTIELKNEVVSKKDDDDDGKKQKTAPKEDSGTVDSKKQVTDAAIPKPVRPVNRYDIELFLSAGKELMDLGVAADNVEAGKEDSRSVVFDLYVQGKLVEKGIEITQAIRAPYVRKVEQIEASDEVVVRLVPQNGLPIVHGMLLRKK